MALPFKNWIWDRLEDVWEYRQEPGTPIYQSLAMMAMFAAVPLVHFQTTWQLVRWKVRHQIAWSAHYALGEIKWAAHLGASVADDAFSMALHGKTMRQMIPRAAKLGAKAIPVLGWALFAYDAYEYYETGRFMGVPVDKFLGIRAHA